MYSLGIVAMETQTSMILPASDRLCSAGMRSIGQGATRPRPWLKEKGWSSTTSIKLMGLGWLESYRILYYIYILYICISILYIYTYYIYIYYNYIIYRKKIHNPQIMVSSISPWLLARPVYPHDGTIPDAWFDKATMPRWIPRFACPGPLWASDHLRSSRGSQLKRLRFVRETGIS